MINTRSCSRTLEEQVHSALAQSPYLSRRLFRRELHCEAQAGRVTLRGVVSSYFHKQMAQETLRRVDGVEEIENLLEVNW